jgi:aminoglycoside 6'-N-acetyltransferase
MLWAHGFAACRSERAMSGDFTGCQRKIAVTYSFRPALRQDLPLLRAWLRTPEVARWWGDPDKQAALLESDLSEPLMVMRIVSLDAHPFAYAQDYDVGSWPQPQFAELPNGSRAIDAFIGEPAMVGRGHGAAFLRLLAERLRNEGAPMIAIDPDAGNLRARRAYRRAGFVEDRVFEIDGGEAVLMIFRD